MSPEYVKNLTRLLDLVDTGELPETSLPRIMYQGAPTVHVYGRSPDDEEIKCVTCKTEGVGRSFTCGCDTPELYCTNFLNTARWKCTDCQHEWDGVDGTCCPSCQKVYG